MKFLFGKTEMSQTVCDQTNATAEVKLSHPWDTTRITTWFCGKKLNCKRCKNVLWLCLWGEGRGLRPCNECWRCNDINIIGSPGIDSQSHVYPYQTDISLVPKLLECTYLGAFAKSMLSCDPHIQIFALNLWKIGYSVAYEIVYEMIYGNYCVRSTIYYCTIVWGYIKKPHKESMSSDFRIE